MFFISAGLIRPLSPRLSRAIQTRLFCYSNQRLVLPSFYPSLPVFLLFLCCPSSSSFILDALDDFFPRPSYMNTWRCSVRHSQITIAIIELLDIHFLVSCPHCLMDVNWEQEVRMFRKLLLNTVRIKERLLSVFFFFSSFFLKSSNTWSTHDRAPQSLLSHTPGRWLELSSTTMSSYHL